MKNQSIFGTGITGTLVTRVIAKAVNTPLSTNPTDVGQGSTIKALWISLDVCGLLGTGVLNIFTAYLFKNPGDNLTPPAPESVGSSNEKKFVIKFWTAMIMRNQDGNNPYHWEGWVPVPKRYQRMGTDDTWSINVECTASATGHASIFALYKWYS